MKFGLVGNIHKPAVPVVAGMLIRWLTERRMPFCVEEELGRALETPLGENGTVQPMAALVAASDMVLSFGGDGTLLHTARRVGAAATPILGINTGRLGFLADTAADELLADMEQVVAGRYAVESRLVLQARRHGAAVSPMFALNDIVIDKGDFSRTITIEVRIGDDYFNTYLSDGVIIATPTGSTAYSLSCGGPILEPSLPGLVINPICPHTLAARPVVINAAATVFVRAHSEAGRVRLFSDGQAGEGIPSGETVEIRRADFDVRLVHSTRRNFYEVLRTKLNWGRGTGSPAGGPPAGP